MSIVTKLKIDAGRALGVASALRLLAGGRARARGAVVLAYHDVTEGEHALEYSVTKAQLREQLTSVRDWGLTFVDLEDLVGRVAAGQDVTGLANVCFDDALLGVYTDGLDVLADLGVPATVFTVAASLGKVPVWWENASRVVDASELKDLVAAGHRIGSHTLTHPSLPALDDAQLAGELIDSRSMLEDITGERVDLLAYPSGHHDARVRRVAGEVGYRAAFTFLNGRVEPGLDMFELPRLTMTAAHHRRRMAFHLARPAWSWPDHQIDVRASGGTSSATIPG